MDISIETYCDNMSKAISLGMSMYRESIEPIRISMNKAYKMYGASNVSRWIEDGAINPVAGKTKNSPKTVSLLELEIALFKEQTYINIVK